MRTGLIAGAAAGTARLRRIMRRNRRNPRAD
jgi:hypothetical protein